MQNCLLKSTAQALLPPVAYNLAQRINSVLRFLLHCRSEMAQSYYRGTVLEDSALKPRWRIFLECMAVSWLNGSYYLKNSVWQYFAYGIDRKGGYVFTIMFLNTNS